MNQILILASLFIFASCVEGGLSHPQLNSSRFVEQYRENLILNLGTVEVISRQGSDIEIDKTTGLSDLKQVSLDQEINSAIIRIEGAKVYRYQEITDKISGKTRRRVTLHKFDPAAEMAQILDSHAGYIEGSYLFFKGTNYTNTKDLTYTYSEKVSHIGRIDLDYAHCSYATESKKTGTLKRHNSPISSLSTVILERSVCGEALTPSELKAIDLKSIEFCNETVTDFACKTSQNLSSLTSNL